MIPILKTWPAILFPVNKFSPAFSGPTSMIRPRSICLLNQPLTHCDNPPYLFKTTAWQQEKLNTQLAFLIPVAPLFSAICQAILYRGIIVFIPS